MSLAENAFVGTCIAHLFKSSYSHSGEAVHPFLKDQLELGAFPWRASWISITIYRGLATMGT